MAEILDLLDTFQVIKSSQGPHVVSSLLESCAFHDSVSQANSSQVQRIFGAISSSIAASSKGSRVSGLKALDMVLGQIGEETLVSTGLKMIQQVAKAISRPGESLEVLVAGYRCLDRLTRLTAGHSDIGRQVAGMISGLVSGCLSCHHPSASLPYLACLMEVYPGSCGHARAAIENMLAGQVGKGKLDSRLIGKCFGLLPQLGGGGKDGADHQKMWSVTLNKLLATSSGILDDLFEHVKEFDKPHVGGFVKLNVTEPLNGVLDKAYSEQRQVCDLLACLSRMLVDSFPQLKAIPVDDILTLSSRILAVTPASLAKSQMQELTVLSAVLPNIHLSAINMVSALIRSCRDELLPVTADINNIILDGIKRAGVGQVKKAVYNLMVTWTEVVGAASSLDICAQQIIELAVHDIVPPEEKIVMSSQTQSTKKKSKKSGGGFQKSSRPVPSIKSGLCPEVCLAALQGLESLLKVCGPYLRPELHKDLGCVLVSQCLDLTSPPPYDRPSCQAGLYSCLTALVLNSSPKFPSPARLAIPVLTKASRHPHIGVARAASDGLAAIKAIIHPRCPSLAVPVLGEEQIEKIVSSIINGKQAEEDEDANDEDFIVETKEVRGIVEKVTTDKSDVPFDLVQDIIKAKASIRNAIEKGDLGKQLAKENNEKQPLAPKRLSTDVLTKETAKKSKFEENLQKVESDKESDNEDDVEDNSENDVKNMQTSDTPNVFEEKPEDVVSSQKAESNSIPANVEPKGSEEVLDVDTMLKDFSDKLNKNLLPNPWESDDDSS